MVDAQVITAAREALGDRPRRVLVTGGTGFVGSRVAWLLAEAGQQVTVCGRNRYRIGRGWHPSVAFAPCDIRDAAAVDELCRDQDVVIHAAALASTWGSAEAFHAVNVLGTQHVVDACRRRPAVRLVHVSSTAIHFEFRDKLDLPEDAPLPRQFACEYAASKAAAEAVIRQAVEDGVDAITIRARAVFGAGDNSLLPRLLKAAGEGRLPQIGPGDNRVDLTYVDNLAYALALALVRGPAGSVCTITNEEPAPLWPTLRTMFARLDMPPLRRRVPYRLALAAASAIAVAHRSLARGEPVLTPYSVGLLATSQTFSPAAARGTLGYRPIVSMKSGIDKTLDALTARDDRPAATSVEVSLHTTGYTPQPYFLAERGRGRQRQPFHALVATIRHPRHGLFLFDTGYAPRFRDATRAFPYSVYGRMSPVVVGESLTIRAQLAAQGVAAGEVQGIIVSHFHGDHVGGLRDFDDAQYIASQRAWQAVAGRRGIAAVRRGFLPDLLPDDFTDRLRTIDHFHDPGIGPFERTHDLFGDGTVRLVELSGHAAGQIGALVQTGPGQRMFLVADATWTLGSLAAGQLPHPLTYSFVDSVSEMRTTLGRLSTFAQQYPDVEIVPTHCPEIARRYRFDETIQAHLQPARPDPSPTSGAKA